MSYHVLNEHEVAYLRIWRLRSKREIMTEVDYLRRNAVGIADAAEKEADPQEYRRIMAWSERTSKLADALEAECATQMELFL